jgi:hypothetical protein
MMPFGAALFVRKNRSQSKGLHKLRMLSANDTCPSRNKPSAKCDPGDFSEGNFSRNVDRTAHDHEDSQEKC